MPENRPTLKNQHLVSHLALVLQISCCNKGTITVNLGYKGGEYEYGCAGVNGCVFI